ncbi:DUF6520 family protein [Winogradskyella sp.]|uniref:DUF6520 family protein n=1 Tax=Winogradskyella sp. TaxID=1883156 RepID=UPI003AB11CD0
MKSFKFKFLLPVMAFLMAIGAAFATQEDGQEDFALEQGYVYINEECQPQGRCDNTQAQVCTHNGFQVFGRSGPTKCLRTLYMNWIP